MTFTPFDHQCMLLALEEAAKGMYSTQPNPRVGCVIAKGDRIISTGWHAQAGGPHAEVFALQAAGSEAGDATAYVTLEPCSHQGRTPPCADALINAGIKRVVIATLDPNSAVNGKGRSKLEAAGISVDYGLESELAEDLNPGFLKRMRCGLPWVRVKVATSLDGRTALKNGESQWISCAESRQDVQKWRARSSAILTGIGTVLADDPNMTARVEQPPLLPLRIVADTRWRTPADSRILLHPSSALIAGGKASAIPRALSDTGVRCLPLPAEKDGVDLRQLLLALAELEVNELQVEAGAILCGSLLQQGLVDEVLLYQAPILLGEGGRGPFDLGMFESMQEKVSFEIIHTCPSGNDLRMRLRPLARTIHE